MKKMILINMVACTVFCAAFLYTKKNDKPVCNMQCCVHTKATKLKENKISSGGGESEEPFLQYNKLFIKI